LYAKPRKADYALLYIAIPKVRQIASRGKKKMADPCHGDTVAKTGAGADAPGVEGVITAEADRGVNPIEGVGAADGVEGAGGAGGAGGVDAVSTGAGLGTMRGVAGFDAMADTVGVELIKGFAGAGVGTLELVIADLPGIGPAHDIASQQRANTNRVAKADLDMCFPSILWLAL
jgi:hypothetical protein